MNREARYWAKVDRRGPAECWPWTGFCNPCGYGIFRSDADQLAHRFGYRIAVGDIPAGMEVCHLCDNPPCQNPKHLLAAPHAWNMADMSKKGRGSKFGLYGERNPRAKLTDKQVDEIRGLYREGGCTQQELADMFSVTQGCISQICRQNQRRSGEPPIDGSVRKVRGERHHEARLSDNQVGEIRRRYASGGVSQAALGREYGVSQATISTYVLGRYRMP